MKSKNPNKDLPNCPKCNSQDGIVGVFVEGMNVTQVFLFCSKCEYTKGVKNDKKRSY